MQHPPALEPLRGSHFVVTRLAHHREELEQVVRLALGQQRRQALGHQRLPLDLLINLGHRDFNQLAIGVSQDQFLIRAINGDPLKHAAFEGRDRASDERLFDLHIRVEQGVDQILHRRIRSHGSQVRTDLPTRLVHGMALGTAEVTPPEDLLSASGVAVFSGSCGEGSDLLGSELHWLRADTGLRCQNIQ